MKFLTRIKNVFKKKGENRCNQPDDNPFGCNLLLLLALKPEYRELDPQTAADIIGLEDEDLDSWREKWVKYFHSLMCCLQCKIQDDRLYGEAGQAYLIAYGLGRHEGRAEAMEGMMVSPEMDSDEA